MRIGKEQKRIIEFLKEHPNKTATQIGMALSCRPKERRYSCNWASKKCLPLLGHGILYRNFNFEYAVTEWNNESEDK